MRDQNNVVFRSGAGSAPHDSRRFVDKVDFVTSPGVSDSRPGLCLPPGPVSLITERARFSFETGTAALAATMPGYSEEDALDGLSWEVGKTADFAAVEAFDDGVLATARSRLAYLFD